MSTQVIVGDLLSYDDMRQAVKGMDYMYFAFAVQGGLLEGSTIAAVVAAEAGTPSQSHPPREPCTSTGTAHQKLCDVESGQCLRADVPDSTVACFRLSF